MNFKPENKTEVIALLIQQLENELAVIITSAENAHLAAVDEQSVAETQYDTLAIEAAYLAHGHSERLASLKAIIARYKKLTAMPAKPHNNVKVNSLITVVYEQLTQQKQQKETLQYFYLGCGAAGNKIVWQGITIKVISNSSPLGKALLGKEVDDEFSFSANGNHQTGYINQIC